MSKDSTHEPMRKTLLQVVTVAVVLATVSFAVIVVNQSAQLVELAGRVHPWAGQVLFWGLLFFYAACFLVPLLLWLRLPRSLVPPAGEDAAEIERYLESLRRRLARNRRLSGLPLTSREEVETALGQLDDAANGLTKAAASRVFLTTALSQNGSLDALFVLGWQSRLVWDIAHVYGQRPSIRDMAWLYGNVMTTAFVAGEIDDLDLSEQIHPVVQSALGGAAGAVPGLQVLTAVIGNSLVSGTANAFLTLRVGVVARRYCGALVRPPKRAVRRAAFSEAAGMLGAIAADGTRKVVAAVAKASGRGVAATVSNIGSRVRSGADSMGSAVRSGAGSVIDALKTRGGDDS